MTDSLIYSKFRGTCVGCGLPIQKGSKMLFSGPGTARHPECDLPRIELRSQWEVAQKLGISVQELTAHALAGRIKYAATPGRTMFDPLEVFRLEMWLENERFKR